MSPLLVLASMAYMVAILSSSGSAARKPNTKWTGEAELGSALSGGDQSVAIVLYCKTKNQANRPDNRLISVADGATSRLQDYPIKIYRVDCSQSTLDYCKASDEAFPRLILHRRKGENVELSYAETRQVDGLISRALHYVLLDMPAPTENTYDQSSDVSYPNPIRVLETSEEYTELAKESKQTAVFFIQTPFSKEHTMALEMAYHHGYLLHFAFTHNCFHIHHYRDQCPQAETMLVILHYYPEIMQHGADMFLKDFDVNSLQTFLFVHSLPPLIISQSVLDIVPSLEQSNLEDLQITYIVAPMDMFLEHQTDFTAAAVTYRGLFAVCHIDPSDKKLVARIPEVKNYLAENSAPVLITRRSGEHRKQVSGTTTYQEPLYNHSTLEDHLRHLIEQLSHTDEQRPSLDQVQSVSAEDWDSFLFNTRYTEQHVFTIQCDDTCNTNIFGIFFQMHRSMVLDPEGEKKATLVFLDRPSRFYPVFRHHHHRQQRPDTYSGEWTFDALMDFVDEYTGLKIGRQPPQKVTEENPFGEEEAPPMEDDDEVALSAHVKFQSMGVGSKTSVPELKHAQFLDNQFASGPEEVIVLHFANFFSPVSKAFVPTFQKAMEAMADDSWVKFNWVNCVDLHDICEPFNVKRFPTVVFMSFPRSSRRYSGALEVDELVAAVRQFRRNHAVKLNSMEEFTSLSNNLVPQQWDRPLSRVSVVVALPQLEDDDLTALDGLGLNFSITATVAYAQGELAKQISNGEQLPFAIVLRHNDLHQSAVRRQLSSQRPLSGVELAGLVKRAALPLVGQLSPATLRLYRPRTTRLLVLFSASDLNDRSLWSGDPGHGEIPDMNFILPRALLDAALMYTNGSLSVERKDDEQSPLVFTWMMGTGPLAASIISTYISPPEMPSLIILDYEKNEVFRFSYQWGASTVAVDKWVTAYLNGQLTASSVLYPGKWTPQKEGYDFLSKAVERGEAVGTNPADTPAPGTQKKRSRISTRGGSTPDPDQDSEGSSAMPVHDNTVDVDEQEQLDTAEVPSDEVIDTREGEDIDQSHDDSVWDPQYDGDDNDDNAWSGSNSDSRTGFSRSERVQSVHERDEL
ncbi:uncharacterized protein LOC135819765 [Sycon ciliatum]|uniref:uncharacterized protein LOC135819765 n=1 Tax=Sycon ciliatum TaxID=27933 RepID=UPI0031F67662